MISYNTAIVLVGTMLLGAGSGLVGSFAVLRRRALTGDALAHAALPGVCLAFMWLGYRSMPAMLLGALATGLLGIALISALRHASRIKEDAAIGIVLGVFYGVGIALSSYIQRRPSVGSKAGLDSFILGKTSDMTLHEVQRIGGVTILCLLLVLMLYKEFKLIAFDPSFASVQGWPSFVLDVVLMAMIAVMVVIGLPAVGVVLVATLLIIPAAAARFWTERLSIMLLLSTLFGAAMGVMGTVPSAYISRLPAGPVIVLMGTLVFLASLFFAPRRGIVARLLSETRFRSKVASQSVLHALFELDELEMPTPRPHRREEIQQETPYNSRVLVKTLQKLEISGDVELAADGRITLTTGGLKRAWEFVRAGRLWDVFLTEHPETARQYANLDSALLMQQLPAEMIDELERMLKSDGRFPPQPKDI